MKEPVHIADLVKITINNRMNEMVRQMNISLYGDKFPCVPPTRLEQFRRWISDNRITNAWLVLIGRADIDRGYD